jgi:hypothetical protein
MRALRWLVLLLPALALPPAAAPARADAVEAAAQCRNACMTQMSRIQGMTQREMLQSCAQRCGNGTTQAPRQAANPGNGQGRAVAGTGAAAAPRTSLGVVYAGRAPSASFGLAIGTGDRMATHREAERQCAGRAGAEGCRMVAEFTAACGAAAQALRRSPGAMFMGSDPQSIVVTSVSAGSGATQQAAEQAAMADCRMRDPQAQCRIAASRCSARG